MLSCTGLVAGFACRLVNMASSLQLIPTKGMTLPRYRMAVPRRSRSLSAGMLLARRDVATMATCHESACGASHVIAPAVRGLFLSGRGVGDRAAARGRRVALMTDARSGGCKVRCSPGWSNS